MTREKKQKILKKKNEHTQVQLTLRTKNILVMFTTNDYDKCHCGFLFIEKFNYIA